jgi:hypothetical protein
LILFADFWRENLEPTEKIKDFFGWGENQRASRVK